MGLADNKVAFITGAALGQGRSHAVRLAEEGADVIITDVCASVHPAVDYRSATREDLEETKTLVEATGRRCVAAVADVRDRQALEAAVDSGLSELGAIDIVVANAGIITVHKHSWDIPEDLFDAVVETNLKGVWHTVVTTAPSMVKARRGGSIILTSSAAGLRGHTPYSHYTASKHGVVGLMRAFSNELAPHGIRVNSIHPTGVLTEGLGSFSERTMSIFGGTAAGLAGAQNMMPDLDADLAAPFAPVQLILPPEVSNAVAWLASDQSRYVTGATLPIDAGNTVKP